MLGFDRDAAGARVAEGLGAVDAATSLRDAVREAELVILCLPLSAMRDTLGKVGPALKEEAVVMDTAPVKGTVLQWVHEFVPAGRYYLGLVPAVTTGAFSTVEGGVKAARADLFKRTVMVVDAPQGTPPEVERLAVNLVTLLGAKPMLAGFRGVRRPDEHCPCAAAAGGRGLTGCLRGCAGLEGCPEARGTTIRECYRRPGVLRRSGIFEDRCTG